VNELFFVARISDVAASDNVLTNPRNHG